MTNPVTQILAWMLELLRQVFVVHGAATRAALAVGLLLVLLYWTLRRLGDNDTDPNLSWRKSSDAGSTSLLVSGVDAVALVAVLVAILLYDTLASNVALGAFLVFLVAVHWYFETSEREGGVGD